MASCTSYLASPAPRTALVLGKALSSAIRGLSQAVVVYALAVVLGIAVSFEPRHVLGVIGLVALGSALFSHLLADRGLPGEDARAVHGYWPGADDADLFASNAIYPIRLMPSWLQVISRLNPLTYEVDGLRTFMLRNGVTTIGIGRDFLVLIATLTVLIGIAARLYPRMGE